MARQYGVASAASTPHIYYGALKARPAAADEAPPAAPTFVELPTTRASGVGPCVLTIDGTHGRRLRLEVSGLTVADLLKCRTTTESRCVQSFLDESLTDYFNFIDQSDR